jgi:putative intracellular protease/amidase/YHS domain-containing protein
MNLIWVWLVVFVIALASAGATWLIQRRNRSQRLRREFGPEYDRAVQYARSRRAAEAALLMRKNGASRIEIQPLGPQSRAKFADAWYVLERRFIRFPIQSLAQADRLARDLMIARGYPMIDFDRRADEISRDHPAVVRNYRSAHAIADRTGRRPATQEDSRKAVGYYRVLFDELLGPETVRLRAARQPPAPAGPEPWGRTAVPPVDGLQGGGGMRFHKAGGWMAAALLGMAGPLLAAETKSAAPAPAAKLTAPATGQIPVAFVLSKGATIIDFTGPWEVFQDVYLPSRAEQSPFSLYTVAETKEPIRASGGMKILPDYTFDNAPPPRVIVIPAQSGGTKLVAWIKKSSAKADVVISVCTGAFILAETGLLSGKSATTHHSFFKSFAMQNPDIELKRGARYVENGNVATAGGLSSGIDLALRVVERYFGREAAEKTAFYMEYQGEGWMKPDSNSIYTVAVVSTAAHPICPVCDMEVDPKNAPKGAFKGKTYYFCSADHKAEFEKAPDKWVR